MTVGSHHLVKLLLATSPFIPVTFLSVQDNPEREVTLSPLVTHAMLHYVPLALRPWPSQFTPYGSVFSSAKQGQWQQAGKGL